MKPNTNSLNPIARCYKWPQNSGYQHSTFSYIGNHLVVITEPPNKWVVFVLKFWGIRGSQGSLFSRHLKLRGSYKGYFS